MLKTLIFAGGILTGAVALPATILYVKPVRNTLSKVLAKRITKVLVENEEARATALEFASEFAVSIAIIDEQSTKKAR